MITLLIASFVAGVLTILAPCVLPLLPIIVGGSASTEDKSARAAWLHPLVIAASLGLSVIVFTLLLKATTAFLGIPQEVWRFVSGGIVLLLGLSFIFPSLWERLPGMSRLNIASNKSLGASYKRGGLSGDALIGASLGPVFNSCSPTYAFIVATVLPTSFLTGLSYLTAYAVGLAGMLLVVALAGRAAVVKLGWLSNPNGWFHRAVGVLFVLVAVAVLFGWDQDLQTFILERGWYDPIGRLEQSLN